MRQSTENGKTRWSELIDMLKCVVALGGLLDQDGIDVLFLNRGTPLCLKFLLIFD